MDYVRKRIALGPLRRKTERNATLVAPCICGAGGVLACVHVWAEWLFSTHGPNSQELVLATPYASFLNELRSDLTAIGVPSAEAVLVGCHAFRHGAARDILEETDLHNTMSRGGWRSDGIFQCVPKADAEAQSMAQVREGLSDDES